MRRRSQVLGVAVRAGLLAAVAAADALAPLRAFLEPALAAVGFPPPLSAVVVAAAGALALAAAGELLVLPFVFRADWLLERRYELSRVRFGTWCGGHLRTVVVTVASWTLAAGVAYAAMGVSGAHWWWVVGAVFAAGTVALAVWGPSLRPRTLRRPRLAARLEALAQRAGAPVTGVHEWPGGAKANAALVGVGSARRVLLTDALIEDYSDAEIEVVVAHELAHHVHRDIWQVIAFRTAVVCAACWTAERLLAGAAPVLGLRGAADPAGLPVLALGVGAAALAALPAANLLSRIQERRADRFALDLTGDHDAFVSGLRRLGSQHLAEERPSRFVQWWFHSHPPVAERVAAARRHGAAERPSEAPAPPRPRPVRVVRTPHASAAGRAARRQRQPG